MLTGSSHNKRKHYESRSPCDEHKDNEENRGNFENFWKRPKIETLISATTLLRFLKYDTKITRYYQKRKAALSPGETYKECGFGENVERALQKYCCYYYPNKTVRTSWNSSYGNWSILETKIVHLNYNSEEKITEYSWETVKYGKIFTFSIGHLDRHFFDKRFKIMIKYTYNDQPETFYEMKFQLEIPYFERFTKLKFIRQEHLYPNPMITEIFKGELKKKPLSSQTLNLLLKLREISEKSPIEQAENPNDRLEMLKYALDLNYLASEAGEKKRNMMYDEYPSRVTLSTTYNALQLIVSHGFERYFATFDDNDVSAPGWLKNIGDLMVDDFEWANKNVANNAEQQKAIQQIVNCSSYPFPFLVHGPPGTGKTSTLVEAVVQILKLKPNAPILITAQSNSACDEITTRLLKSVSRNKIFRFYSSSLDIQLISNDLRSISNRKRIENEYPSYEELYNFKVVITTLVTAGRLSRSRISAEHFQYVFIDECAACTEPESWIPIMGLVTQPRKITASLVFLGDPYQLRPIVESQLAAKLGLTESLMERCMKLPKYSKPYNPKFVVQLLDNFRSNESILHFSNQQFYDGNLRSKADPDIANFALGWSLLPNKKFPIILHSVIEPCELQKYSHSWYNSKEIKVVVDYVLNLLKNGINGKKVEKQDIGIVTPYKAQCTELKRAFSPGFIVEIGTAEYFQGREKKIIIISTVKSGGSVGFLNDERRLNVTLTRAKCLTILVCNPETLKQNSMWNLFIDYLIDNKAMVGENKKHPRIVWKDIS